MAYISFEKLLGAVQQTRLCFFSTSFTAASSGKDEQNRPRENGKMTTVQKMGTITVGWRVKGYVTLVK